MSSRAAVAVALLLVVAGCSAPTAQSPPETATPTPEVASSPATESAPGTTDDSAAAADSTPTTTPTSTPRDPQSLAASYDVEVRDGELPVDPALVFARLQVLLGTEATPPEAVLIEPDEEMGFGTATYPAFYRLFGIHVPDGRNRTLTAAGYVRDPSYVHLNAELTDNATATESVLAHESVHVVQFETGQAHSAQAVIVGDDLRGVTTDDRQTYFAVIEGTAVHAERAYWRKYIGTGPDPAGRLAEGYRESEGAPKLGFARYRFGFAYVDARAASTREHGRVYEEPPRTSEELLHHLPPGSEPSAALNLSNAGEWEERRGYRDRMGELWLRVVLATELNESAAAAGADGWGADEKRGYVRDGQRGFAWVLRWDDPANATEFHEVFARYLDERATRTDDARWVDEDAATGEPATFRLVWVDDRTVAVLAGDEAFVDAATLRTENGTVVVDA